ncbi:unnamed protein product [Owenia fusiformis]|uniref:Solute carrier family 12 member 8 n=1 Tax=Owenia fusiformis TaxID=6347 RepID=A0A8S4N4G9_OWEFU|nr:unnamed protein product [Owenia fusiformis]
MDYQENETETLLTQNMKKEAKKPDWSKFGLATDDQHETEPSKPLYQSGGDEGGYHGDPGQHNELYTEDEQIHRKPWYKANFFVTEPVLFGAWDGVFTSCMINIFGVIIFLRTGWVVGNAGIGLAILIMMMTIGVALVAALSAIGVCERCKMESGGVYFLISHVLGARIGAAVGILYCFGQAVSCSLYCMGFGESISALINQDNPWVSRGIAAGVVFLLLGINVAGVKWVIRLQLLLLMVLFIAAMDFLVGSFVHTDPEHGITGYRWYHLVNNTGPSYLEGQSFFSVFGVFFPTATGVFAGINMSGDLHNPSRDIPVGTLSAVGVSTVLYLAFGVVLGATCDRTYLQHDYMIAEKVSILGVLWLAGLYISSVSSCMGALYGSPRILQSIANENVIPVMKFLGQGRGPNKVPVFALIVITLIALVFIMIGQVNTLGPIVTMPFMITYAAVDYAYFSLAMSFDQRKKREARFHDSAGRSLLESTIIKAKSEGQSQNGGGTVNYGTTDSKQTGSTTAADTTRPQKSSDLDKLFPERLQHDQRMIAPGDQTSPTFDVSKGYPGDQKGVTQDDGNDTQELLGKKPQLQRQASQPEIYHMPRSWYSVFCNRWLSIIGLIGCLVIMFAIQWIYALANIAVAFIVYIYVGKANPGVFPGIAEFNLWQWVKGGVLGCFRRGPPPPEQIVVTPNTPAMNTMAAQLTEENDDFAARGRYHQSEVVKGQNFDDLDSD